MGNVFAEEFGCTKAGKNVTAFILENDSGMKVRILDYGGTIQSIVVPDKDSKPTDVALGYDDILSYETGNCYYGAIVGRYANRIANGRFFYNGREYDVGINEGGKNHLHGIFSQRIFESRIDKDELVLKYLSPDMEEGYPGNLSLTVRYSLSNDNELAILYTAFSDKDTVVNLTNHSYFNLNGQDGSTILEHKMMLNSREFTEIDESMIPTGKITSVANTPFDFSRETTVGSRINEAHRQLRIAGGYDHNMILSGKAGELKLIGNVTGDKTGISMTAYTTEPAVQFYSGNFMDGDTTTYGKGKIRYPKCGGFCFEAQHYPDSVNHPEFPDTLLEAGEEYRQMTLYKFKSREEK